MSASELRLVFQGKIAPDQDLAEVKSRLQKLFKKDAATIDKMFGGKKVCLKQGLTQSQAEQYQQKMRSIGVLCDIEEPKKQKPTPVVAARTSSPISTTSPQVVSGGMSSSQPSKDIAEEKPLKLADIDKAFVGTIPRVELPSSYKAGIVAVGMTMVLLPVLYAGLIALMGLGVVSHAVSHTSWMQSLGYKFGVIAYVTPIIVGVTVMLFMIKPFFARVFNVPKTLILDPLKEPVFFHFVNKIAISVGAPRPRQIEVDCQVNASASFRKGIFSFFGDDLVLTIGMPLLAGFNTRQLAGVLAHEFGHFSQGVGMRFHYLTHKVNSWFFNAVYLRDSWDEKLEQVAEESDGWVSLILNFARGGVWATRKLLYVFMMAGHAVSSYMLRQMEFDADRYEAQMAGSEQFKDTTLQLQRLGVAFQVSHDQLAQAWEDKKLVDNLPRLIAHNASELPEELDRALLKQMQESRTQVYDSHPSDNERIDNAMAQQANGLISTSYDIHRIFRSFDVMAKQVSYTYYAHELGLEFDRNKLVDVNQVVQITEENEKQQEAYYEYFKDMAPLFELPISVNIFDTSETDWDDLLIQYQAVNDQIVEQIAERRRLMQQTNNNFELYQLLTAIHVLRESGFILFPQWFNMDEQTFSRSRENLPKVEQALQQMMQQLRNMFELNDRRLSIALTLLNHPRLIERNSHHADHLKTRNRLSLLINNVQRNAEYITDFEFKHFKLASLTSCAPLMGQKPEELPDTMNGLLEEVKNAYNLLIEALGRLDYPFVAEGEHLTIADYISDFLPHQKHIANEAHYYVKSGEIILEKVESIYARIISGLANIALSIDRLLPNINEEYHVSEQRQQETNLQDSESAATNSVIAAEPLTVSIPEPEPADAVSETSQVSSPEVSSHKVNVNGSTSNSDEPATVVTTQQSAVEIVDDVPSQPIQPLDQQSVTSTTEYSNKNNEPMAKAVFSIDESVEKPEQNIELPGAVQSDTADDELKQEDAIDVKNQLNDSVAELKRQVTGKAVFAIDDSNDEEEAVEQEGPAVPEARYSGKAVFSIDETVTPTDVDDHKNADTAVPETSNPETESVEDESTVEKKYSKQESPSLTLDSMANDAPVLSDAVKVSDGNDLDMSIETSDSDNDALNQHNAAATAENSLVTESKAQVLSLESMESSGVAQDADESQQSSNNQESDDIDKPSGLTLELEPVIPASSTMAAQRVSDDDEEKEQLNQNPPQAAQS